MNRPANRGQHHATVNVPAKGTEATAAGLISKIDVRPPTLWRAFASLGIWAVCFTVLYTGHALACTMIAESTGTVLPLGSRGSVTGLLVAIWLFFLLWLSALALRSVARARAVQRQTHYKEGGAPVATPAADYVLQDPASAGWVNVYRRSLRFMVMLTLVTDLSSVVITVISGLPIILTPACL